MFRAAKRRELTSNLHIRELVENMHRRCISYLCRTFHTVVIPHFPVKQMVKNKRAQQGRFVLSAAQKRALLSLQHYQFKIRLYYKLREYRGKLALCHEQYTSKACSQCGTLNRRLGGNATYECINPACTFNGVRYVAGRDDNAARNILLKALAEVAQHRYHGADEGRVHAPNDNRDPDADYDIHDFAVQGADNGDDERDADRDLHAAANGNPLDEEEEAAILRYIRSMAAATVLRRAHHIAEANLVEAAARNMIQPVLVALAEKHVVDAVTAYMVAAIERRIRAADADAAARVEAQEFARLQALQANAYRVVRLVVAPYILHPEEAEARLVQYPQAREALNRLHPPAAEAPAQAAVLPVVQANAVRDGVVDIAPPMMVQDDNEEEEVPQDQNIPPAPLDGATAGHHNAGNREIPK